jgi:hypothetical protein
MVTFDLPLSDEDRAEQTRITRFMLLAAWFVCEARRLGDLNDEERAAVLQVWATDWWSREEL